MSKFKVGDRVRVADSIQDKVHEGSLGVVVQLLEEGDWYLVDVEGYSNLLWFREWGLRPAEIHPQVMNMPVLPVQDPDPVSRPAHYTQGMPQGVEVIDVIRAQDAGFEHANVIKYILRWKYKSGVEDLKKAQQYLQWLIEKEEADNE